jgi:hypothetical protein
MMEAVSSSELLVNVNQTAWRDIPEDSRLHMAVRTWNLIMVTLFARPLVQLVPGVNRPGREPHKSLQFNAEDAYAWR